MTTTSLTSSRGAGRAGDKVFSGATLAAGCLILAVLFGVALFLVVQAFPALTASPDTDQGRRRLLRLHLADRDRHAHRGHDRPGDRHADRDRRRAVHLALRPAAARLGPRLRGRPAGRHSLRGLRRLGCGVPGQGNLAGLQLAGQQHGLAADLPGPGLGHRQDHPDRGNRAGRHDPAHHHLPDPRDLPADPQAARGSLPGARRHAVGNDQNGGPAVRPPRNHQRRHAGPGPRTGRDHGRCAGAVLRRPHREPDPDPATRPSPPRLR